MLFSLAIAQASDTQALREFHARIVPLAADLKPLDEVFANVRVVGLGEATHGSREIFQQKGRLFQFLVERHGFRVLALESSMAECLPIDRFVIGGAGTAEGVLRKQSYWAWQTQEIADLLKWMRRANATRAAASKLRVIGVDMQDKLPLWQALVAELKVKGVKDPIFDDPLWLATKNYEGKIGEAVTRARAWTRGKDALLQRLVVAFEQSIENDRLLLKGEELYERSEVMSRGAEIKRLADEALATRPNLSRAAKDGLKLLSSPVRRVPSLREMRAAAKELRSVEGLGLCAEALETIILSFELAEENAQRQRDRSMATNLRWIYDSYLPKQKIAFWAHNSHVGNIDIPGKFRSTGYHLTKSFVLGYFPLGSVFGSGGLRAIGVEGKVESFTAPPAAANSFDALMAGLDERAFILSFDGFARPLKQWLVYARLSRGVGASYNPSRPDQYYEALPMGSVFRGILFIPRLTAATPLSNQDHSEESQTPAPKLCSEGAN
ncbi:MAG TPA: erythromycin esterase family protein [Fimbriimonas sp.]|nr:erythromycin esterase family protein [Fimbriimonas sp.]